jgi:hypothetical protein
MVPPPVDDNTVSPQSRSALHAKSQIRHLHHRSRTMDTSTRKHALVRWDLEPASCRFRTDTCWPLDAADALEARLAAGAESGRPNNLRTLGSPRRVRRRSAPHEKCRKSGYWAPIGHVCRRRRIPHNPKVAGSNPAPAIDLIDKALQMKGFFFWPRHGTSQFLSGFPVVICLRAATIGRTAPWPAELGLQRAARPVRCPVVRAGSAPCLGEWAPPAGSPGGRRRGDRRR